MNKDKFCTDLLNYLKFPANRENLKFLKAWYLAENTQAKNNPFATTQPMPGATIFNYANVRNYATYQDGIKATADTILNGYYPNIIKALNTQQTALEKATDPKISNDFKTWGTSLNNIISILRAGRADDIKNPYVIVLFLLVFFSIVMYFSFLKK